MLDTAYRIYITDAVKAIAENTANYAGGKAPTVRYADFLTRRMIEEMNGEQMVADVLERAGIKVVSK